MIYPLVRELAEDSIPARDLPHLDVLPQGYYRWRKSPVTRRDLENA